MAKQVDLVENFKSQLEQIIDSYAKVEIDPQAAVASGIAIIVSSLIKHDGPRLSLYMRAVDKAICSIAAERGWHTIKARDTFTENDHD